MECVPGECPTLKGEEQHCTNMVITQRKFPATEVFYVSTRVEGVTVEPYASFRMEQCILEVCVLSA